MRGKSRPTARPDLWYNHQVQEQIMLKRLYLIVLTLLLIAGMTFADEFVNPKANIPPKAAPQRRNAGEGVPPLPLPATPLRRSEKKREPSPPALLGNITFSDLSAKKAKLNCQTTIIDLEQ